MEKSSLGGSPRKVGERKLQEEVYDDKVALRIAGDQVSRQLSCGRLEPASASGWSGGPLSRFLFSHPAFWAVLIMATSAFVYSLQNVVVKKAGKGQSFWTISFFRGAVGMAAALVSALLTKSRKGPLFGAHKHNIKWLVLRGLLGGVTIITAFIAVLKIDLSDATVIIATSTLWTAAMSVMFEKGSWSRGDTVAAILCIGGIVLVAKPGPLFGESTKETDPKMLLGFLCALLSAISQAGVNMTIRRIKEEDTSVITLYAMLGCALLALPGMLWEQINNPDNGLWNMPVAELIPLMSTGLLSYGAQMLKTLALQMSKGVGVLVVRYLETIFSFAWDFTIFHAELDMISICGAILIISGCITSMFAKALSDFLSDQGARLFHVLHPNQLPLPTKSPLP